MSLLAIGCAPASLGFPLASLVVSLLPARWKGHERERRPLYSWPEMLLECTYPQAAQREKLKQCKGSPVPPVLPCHASGPGERFLQEPLVLSQVSLFMESLLSALFAFMMGCIPGKASCQKISSMCSAG